MIFFDTHFHFYGDCEPEKYYSEAAESGVKYLLAAGAGMQESSLARDFAHKIENSWFSAGVHPHEAEKYIADITCFDIFKGDEKLVAVGEIGLDYFYENSDRKTQAKVFSEFLALALEWKLPALVHCRDKDGSDDAYKDSYGLLSDFAKDGGTFELHCCAASLPWAEKFLALGASMGIAGIVTFPKASNIRELLKVIPDDRLLLETDAPYLAPVPHRGQKNHSRFMVKTAEKVALEKNISMEKLSEITLNNSFRFFKLEGGRPC